jgi:hypothetical protein
MDGLRYSPNAKQQISFSLNRRIIQYKYDVVRMMMRRIMMVVMMMMRVMMIMKRCSF